MKFPRLRLIVVTIPSLICALTALSACKREPPTESVPPAEGKGHSVEIKARAVSETEKQSDENNTAEDLLTTQPLSDSETTAGSAL